MLSGEPCDYLMIVMRLRRENLLEPGPQGTPGVEAAAMNSNQSNNNW